MVKGYTKFLVCVIYINSCIFFLLELRARICKIILIREVLLCSQHTAVSPKKIPNYFILMEHMHTQLFQF